MDQRCSIEGCPGSPKYWSQDDPTQIFCSEHQSVLQSKQQGLRVQGQGFPTFAIHEMGKLSGFVSEVMKTGKGMFEEICNKLCSITDELAQRQQDLLSLAQNVSSDEQATQEIIRLSSVGIRLRNREDFAKLVDQHFSQHDATVDFSLFSEDIKGIKEKLQESNDLIQFARQESDRDRENREKLVQRMESIEQSTHLIRNETEQKINELKWNFQIRASQLAQKNEFEQLFTIVKAIEERVNRNDQFIDEYNDKTLIIRQGVVQQNEEFKRQEQLTLEHMNILFKRYEEFNAGIQKNLADFTANQNRQANENENKRNELTKKAHEGLNKDFKKKSKEDLKAINDFNKKIKDEFNDTKNWLELKMQEFEQNFKDKVRKEVLDFQESKRLEDVRIEKERLKKINDDNVREQQRQAEIKRKEDEIKKKEEEQKKKEEELKKKNKEEEQR